VAAGGEAMTGPTFWHGGGRIAGDFIEPPEVSGVSRSGDEGVHITTERGLAETYAATVEGPAWIYEVEPLSEPVPVPPLIGGPTISYRCERARIIRRFTLENRRRARLRRVVGIADDVIERGTR
jgi:hypothetical protein